MTRREDPDNPNRSTLPPKWVREDQERTRRLNYPPAEDQRRGLLERAERAERGLRRATELLRSWDIEQTISDGTVENLREDTHDFLADA